MAYALIELRHAGLTRAACEHVSMPISGPAWEQVRPLPSGMQGSAKGTLHQVCQQTAVESVR